MIDPPLSGHWPSPKSKRTTDILASSMGGSLFEMNGDWEVRVTE